MKKLFTLVLLATALITQAQHQADNWYFGANIGVTFASGLPVPLTGGQINTQEGCASISDTTGNLVFYTDGVTVWDKNHLVMPNGTGLFGYSSSTQSALIVPKPGSTSQYYIFTAPEYNSSNAFCYSTVDMNLNSGNGDVVIKNAALLANSTEKVTAVNHSNGIDVWVIAHEFNTANFYAYFVDTGGISLSPVISSVGTIMGPYGPSKLGYLRASSCGEKLAAAVYYHGFIEMYDFSTTTGIITNPIQLGNHSTNSEGAYGVEFSPDGSRLYFAYYGPNMVTQYDLTAGSAAAIIASCNTIYFVSSSSNFGAIQNGPDGKMYLARENAPVVSCITNPNLPGTACNFVDNYITVPSGNSQLGLPNFIT